MNIQELRIGNWVLIDYDTSYYARVSEISERYGVTVNRSVRVANSILFPIPLTPEILEKAGFEFDKELPYSNWQYGVNSDKYDIFHCYWDGGKLTYLGLQITYLHQLQNLYFALTGEELNIEL